MTGLALAAQPGAGPSSSDTLVSQVRTALDRLVSRADDGTAIWSGPAAALGHSFHATTPEDAARGNHVASLGPLRLVADARIDNRDDVIDALGLPALSADPEVLVAAWEAWGERAIARVIGDYAFAVWNEDTRELALARDAMGMRPLYFARRGEIVLCASELHALGVGELAVTFDLDPDEATRFLVDRYSEASRTIYRGVDTVTPGGVVIFGKGGARRIQVWKPDPFARAPRADFAGHVERVRDVLGRAVLSRMRSVDEPSFLVSGGVDSSVVTCLAHHLAPPTRPRMMLHLSQRGAPFDETEHFERVAAAVGGRVVMENPRDFVDHLGPDSDLVAPGELYDVTITMGLPLLTRLPPGGRNVLLNGTGSDDILQESGADAATHLVNGRLREAWESARRMTEGSAQLGAFVAREMARTFLPLGVRAALRDLRPSRLVWPAWLMADARRRLDQWHRDELRRQERMASPDDVQRGIALMFSGAFDLFSLLARTDYLARVAGFEGRCPYYDRRVVEALMALPHELRFHRGVTKPILRAVGEGFTPQANLDRSDPAHFSSFIEAVRRGPHHAAWASRLRAPELERIGVARPGALRALLETQPGHRALTRAMALEVSFRTLRDATQRTGAELRARARALGAGVL